MTGNMQSTHSLDGNCTTAWNSIPYRSQYLHFGIVGCDSIWFVV